MRRALTLFIAIAATTPALAQGVGERDKDMRTPPAVERPTLERAQAEGAETVARPTPITLDDEDASVEHLTRAIALMEERVGIQWCTDDAGHPVAIDAGDACP